MATSSSTASSLAAAADSPDGSHKGTSGATPPATSSSAGDAHHDASQELRRAVGATCEVLAPFLQPKLLASVASRLRRPPFKTIRVIFEQLNDRTGFGSGLFSAEELAPEALGSKKGKMWFIAKLVAVVGRAMKVELQVSAAKVVAGLEPVTTLRFLRLLATAAQLPASDWKAAVQAVHASAESRKQQLAAAPSAQSSWQRGHAVRSQLSSAGSAGGVQVAPAGVAPGQDSQFNRQVATSPVANRQRKAPASPITGSRRRSNGSQDGDAAVAVAASTAASTATTAAATTTARPQLAVTPMHAEDAKGGEETDDNDGDDDEEEEDEEVERNGSRYHDEAEFAEYRHGSARTSASTVPVAAAAAASPAALKLASINKSYEAGGMSTEQYMMMREAILDAHAGEEGTSAVALIAIGDSSDRGGFSSSRSSLTPQGKQRRRQAGRSAAAHAADVAGSDSLFRMQMPQLPSVAPAGGDSTRGSGSRPGHQRKASGASGAGAPKKRAKKKAPAAGSSGSKKGSGKVGAGAGAGSGGNSSSRTSMSTRSSKSSKSSKSNKSTKSSKSGNVSKPSSSRPNKGLAVPLAARSSSAGNERKRPGTADRMRRQSRASSASRSRRRAAQPPKAPMPDCAKKVIELGGKPLFDPDWLFQFDARFATLQTEADRQREGRARSVDMINIKTV